MKPRNPPGNLIDGPGFQCGTIDVDVRRWHAYDALRDEHLPDWIVAEPYDLGPVVCGWCGTDANLVIDHCHGCGRVRGWLCRICNAIEGQGRTLPGWPEKCNGNLFYQGRDWTTGSIAPSFCGGTDAFATALRDWWRRENPDLWIDVVGV